MAVNAELTIRKYRADDLESMFALDCVCFAEVYRFSRRVMRRFAEAHDAVSLVAVNEEGVLAGFAIVQMEGTNEGRYGYMVTLDVAPELRGHGVALRLIAAAEQEVTERGGSAVALHVSTENKSAMRFYEKAGYERVGAEAGFYGTGLDAFVYLKLLPGC